MAASGLAPGPCQRESIKHLALVGNRGDGALGEFRHLIDPHGDLGAERENHIRLGVRGSNIGIKPFDMEVTKLGGGPSAQAGEMVGMLKRRDLASIGPKQEMIFRQLIIDTFRRVAILEADPDT